MNYINKLLKPITHIFLSLVLTAFINISLGQSRAIAANDSVLNYPNQPIHFIVPYAAGGPLDGIARLLANNLQSKLGQTIIVENKAGAGGNIGLNLVAKAKADGYYLGMGAVATMAINPWIYKNKPFDPAKDLDPIVIISSVPNVLLINKDFAASNHIDSVASLIQYLQQNGSAINYSSGGNGSAGHLAAELFKAKTKTEMTHIPFSGANPAKLALLANQVQVMFDNLASALPLINNKDVVALAVTGIERSTFLQDIPTLQESGLSDFDIATWFGVVTTANTPKEIIHKLNGAYTEALQNKEIQKQLKNMGSLPVHSTPEEFAKFAHDEYNKYKNIVKISGAAVN